MTFTAIVHCWNEIFLIKSWLQHMSRLADRCVLLDFGSDDGTVEYWEEHRPSDWPVIQSQMEEFDALGLDAEVMGIESRYTGWKMVFCVTEVLLHWDVKAYLAEWEKEHPESDAIAMRSCIMIDHPAQMGVPLDGRDLFLQRSFGFDDREKVARPWRYLHRAVHGQYNQVGRHATGLPYAYSDELFLLWWGFSPWPEVKARKLQIQERIPPSNRAIGWGHQHIVTPEELEARFVDSIPAAEDLMRHAYYRERVERICAEHFL